MEEFLYYEGGETVEQIAEGSCGSPSLDIFKARLDGALRNLLSKEVSLLIAGVLELCDL